MSTSTPPLIPPLSLAGGVRAIIAIRNAANAAQPTKMGADQLGIIIGMLRNEVVHPRNVHAERVVAQQLDFQGGTSEMRDDCVPIVMSHREVFTYLPTRFIPNVIMNVIS